MLQYRILLLQKTEKKSTESRKHLNSKRMLLKCIYNPITAMGFSAMFIFQLDNIAGTPLT